MGDLVCDAAVLVVVLALFIVSGCASIGPGAVKRDRFDYNTAISDSWKEQTLLNIVKLRYADMPVFVEVTSVVSGYTLESSVDLGTRLSAQSRVDADIFTLNTGGKFTDRPTITYAPITGEKFNKSFMTPIPPKAIMFLIQSGWPADKVFPLTVDSINGLRGRVLGGSNRRYGDPDYYRAVRLIRKIQKSGDFGMQIEKSKDKEETVVLFFHGKNMTTDIKAASAELNELLGLKPGLRKIKVRYGLIARDDTEVAMITRSLMNMMIDLATQVDVPLEDVKSGRTIATLNQPDIDEDPLGRNIRINQSTERSANSFTAVKYRDRWFWIDDRDFQSKRTFTFLMILFSLTETGGQQRLPIVTIPTN